VERRIGNLTVRTHQGDIADMKVDAIVNAANSHLWMGSGVAGAIKSRGGQEIEEEAMRQGPIQPGGAVITTGGRLPASYVIHCAGMPPGGRADYDAVHSSVRAALRIASEHGLSSIAFPAIGAGVGGLSLSDSARAILTAVQSFAEHSGSVREIVVVGLTESSVETFDNLLDKLT